MNVETDFRGGFGCRRHTLSGRPRYLAAPVELSIGFLSSLCDYEVL